eukprot:TRINITY_DN5964_c0_g2_i1.p1 TRINITY_DN5964_c0_g2~~TRINITY_DN5964_c0_g2_i1.p1  ORF type:complete len:395 (-),score=45.72 TRINITY_DN5964_c0_g2_i1:424-1608(-)
MLSKFISDRLFLIVLTLQIGRIYAIYNCSDFPSRFLIPVRAMEQLGKGELHFHDYIKAAMFSNRTLVLPTYKDGRANFTLGVPHEELYDTSKLPKGLSWVTSGQYIDCSKKLGGQNRSLVRMVWGEETRIHTRYKDSSHCSVLENIIQFSKIYPSVGALNHTTLQSQKEVEYLLHNTRAVTDVALYSFKVKIIWKMKNFQLELSPRWSDVGFKLRNKLSPYFGVQWRTETVSANFTQCASYLIHYLHHVRQKHHLKKIYFASDMNEHGQVVSSSYVKPNSAAVTGIRYLLESLGSLNYTIYRKNDVIEEFRELTLGDEYLLETFVDRISLIFSDYFIVGPRGCAKPSNFIQRIYDARSALGKTIKFKNHLDIWPLSMRVPRHHNQSEYRPNKIH